MFVMTESERKKLEVKRKQEDDIMKLLLDSGLEI
jgi:hypothetical protein